MVFASLALVAIHSSGAFTSVGASSASAGSHHALELHAEHEAEHLTPLYRRPPRPKRSRHGRGPGSHRGSGEDRALDEDDEDEEEDEVLSFRRQQRPAKRAALVAQEGSRVHGEGEHEHKAPGDDAVNLTTTLEDMTSEYIGLIGVGTSNAGSALFQARVVFDTGSTNLWVASVLCKEPPCTSDRARGFYDPQKSVTQESYISASELQSSAFPVAPADLSQLSDDAKDIDIIFGTGELRGPLHVDTYRVGPMVVQHQPFAMIRSMHGDVFSSFPFEGILGLGFPSLSFGDIKPFFEHVIEQKLLKSNEFSFFLNADPQKPSAILWGGVDKSLYEGPIRMFPVVEPHYWAMELLGFSIGGQQFGNGQLRRLIVDTGTTYFTAPEFMFNDVVGRIPSAPCSEVDQDTDRYPPLTFTLRNSHGAIYNLEVPQEAYMLGDGDETSNMRNDEGNCRPAFMQLDVSKKYGPAMILGEVFMRSFFTVFSRGNGNVANAKIGFARSRVGAVPKSVGAPSLLQPADKAAEEEEQSAAAYTGPPAVEFASGIPRGSKPGLLSEMASAGSPPPSASAGLMEAADGWEHYHAHRAKRPRRRAVASPASRLMRRGDADPEAAELDGALTLDR